MINESMRKGFPRNTNVVFECDGEKYLGYLANYWGGANIGYCILESETCPNKEFLKKAPNSCLLAIVSTKEVYVVTHIIEGAVCECTTYVREYDAENRVNAILNEVVHKSNEKTDITLFKNGVGFGWMDTELGEWGNVSISKSVIRYDCDYKGDEYEI